MGPTSMRRQEDYTAPRATSPQPFTLGAFILLQHFNPLHDALQLVAKGRLNISSQLHRIACSTTPRCSSASPCSPARDPIQGWIRQIRCRHSFPSILPCCRLAFCHSRLPLSTKSSNISWQSMLRICWALPSSVRCFACTSG
jgi:hypothetical protein